VNPFDVIEAADLRDTLGCSEVAAGICGQVTRVAGCDFAVLILGEMGTGTEMVARVIHRTSARAHRSFVAVDCGAIPEANFERELFGQARERARPGRFGAAAGGTLFLDDIPRIPLACQARMLRALPETLMYPGPTSASRNVDARVIAAASPELDDCVARGAFRRDLFFRLSEFVIQIPPLRERNQDIVFLAERFVELTSRELHKATAGISERALQRLLDYDWPGNVQQLRATLRRAVLLADTVVDEEHLALPGISGPRLPPRGSALPLKQLVRSATVSVERAALLRALDEAGGNRTQAARLLQIDYKTMRTKLKEYGIAVPPRRGS
jgi:DNA-binding NtrC family response regulator